MTAPAPPVHYGPENNRYNGGLCFNTAQGRWVICCRDATLMLYSRGVMAAAIGRLLRSDEIVHHRNENTQDDRLANLELTTRAGHVAMHREKLNAARVGRLARGERHGNAKLSDAQVVAIRAEHASGDTGVNLARRYGVTPSAISAIVRGKTRRP